MSGGHFDYNQYSISEISDSIKSEIYNSGKKKSKEDLSYGELYDGYHDEYPQELYYYKYPPNIIQKFKDAVNALDKAYVYAQRIDWLLSGDDSDESFIRRLDDELNKLKEHEL